MIAPLKKNMFCWCNFINLIILVPAKVVYTVTFFIKYVYSVLGLLVYTQMCCLKGIFEIPMHTWLV